MLDDHPDQTETSDTSGSTGAEGVADAPATEPEIQPATVTTTDTGETPAAKKTARKRVAKKTTTAKKTAAKRATKKAAAVAESPAEAPADPAPEAAAPEAAPEAPPEVEPPRKRATRKRAAKKTAEPAPETAGSEIAEPAATAVLFQAPEPTTPRKRASRKKAAAAPVVDETPDEKSDENSDQTPQSEPVSDDDQSAVGDTSSDTGDTGDAGGDTGDGDESGARRRSRRRGGRRRRRGGAGEGSDDDAGNETQSKDGQDDESGAEGDDEDSARGSGSRRRRRRRRSGEDGGSGDDPENTVTRTRKPRNPEDEITALSGSTRLEAKKQRRREGREAGRRRAPIVSEAEFLARRESVERAMVIRQRDDLTQIAVLEDKVLVEHYVARASQTSLIGNVYLGRVQNVLPSMEAAFIDIGKGRNAVLYAGEVNWKALGAKDGQPRKVESVLSSGQTILVQVTKDPVGHKGARLTGQITLPGRFLVYVPDGTTSGISRKLPDTERARLKTLLREVVPDTASVIVRTAAEGASEDELTADVERLKARWTDIEAKISGGQAPQLLYGEPDLTLKVVRDLFTEDFTKLVIQGSDAWDLVDGYVTHVAPDLRDRLEKYDPAEHDDVDLFASHRLEEQIAKGLDRKVWLPSGGSLIIDRTEAMTVVDVNTGKFTGSGGNLEETVTKNNLEAAEEIVRQLRLRDIGGIIVIDFIDMVLESNRDLVLRRLVECLGRDRTRHQVAEVTSLGLVQMTRKRLGTGLLEAFSEECEHCKGRGLLLHEHPIEPSTKLEEPERRGGRRSRGGRGRTNGNGTPAPTPHPPTPADLAAMPRHEPPPVDESAADDEPPSHDVPTETEAPGTEDAAEETPVVADASVELETEPAPETAPETVPETLTEPGSTIDPVEELDPTPPVAEPEPTPEPEPVDPAPRLVTSTRRRTARRAAGPPAAPAVTTDDETPTDDTDEQDSAGSLFHVPVKRKGSRRK